MELYIPTRLISGENCIKNNSAYFSMFGEKALIVTGKRSAEISGALADVTDVLDAQGINWTMFNHVENNPTIETCYAGGQAAKDFGASLIIAIGGGSPMDAAKAIATYAVNELKPMEIYHGNFKNKPLPIISIPLTAGTGSEITPYSVLTVHSLENKKTFTHPDNFSKVAFLDPNYLKSLPKSVLYDTVADALSHGIESILCKRDSMMSQVYAEASIKLISEALEGVLSGNPDLEKLLFASSLAGMAISQTGTVIVHSMGYMLTYYKGTPHGRANALLLPGFLKLCQKHCPEKLQIVLRAFGAKDVEPLIDGIKSLVFEKTILSLDEVSAFSHKAFQAKNVSQTLWDLTEQEEALVFSDLLD